MQDRKEYYRQYYRKNRKRIIQRVTERRKANPDKARQQQRELRSKNRDKFLAKERAYYAANSERILANKRESQRIRGRFYYWKAKALKEPTDHNLSQLDNAIKALRQYVAKGETRKGLDELRVGLSRIDFDALMEAWFHKKYPSLGPLGREFEKGYFSVTWSTLRSWENPFAGLRGILRGGDWPGASPTTIYGSEHLIEALESDTLRVEQNSGARSERG